jgi:hypothetical protein
MLPLLLVSILCLFHEFRHLKGNIYAYFSSVRLDRHMISSNSASMWSSSEVLRDARQVRGVGRQPNTIPVGHMTSFKGQNLHIGSG